jgi:hypothetical protein
MHMRINVSAALKQVGIIEALDKRGLDNKIEVELYSCADVRLSVLWQGRHTTYMYYTNFGENRLFIISRYQSNRESHVTINLRLSSPSIFCV